jgi:predicted benzoate:H+ symporter BenE
LSDEDRWRRTEPTGRGPSTPSTQRFDPVATALGVFFAVAIPVVVVGYTRPGGASATIIAIGIIAGLLAGVLAGIWVKQRDGRVWRDPRL